MGVVVGMPEDPHVEVSGTTVLDEEKCTVYTHRACMGAWADDSQLLVIYPKTILGWLGTSQIAGRQ